MKKIFLFSLSLCLLAGTAASAATPYKNTLPKNKWVTYGVNPWRADTDFDGQDDAWEISNRLCPTSQQPTLPLSTDCPKGKIDLKKGIYTPPAIIKNYYPREMKTFASCKQMDQLTKNSVNLDLNSERQKNYDILTENLTKYYNNIPYYKTQSNNITFINNNVIVLKDSEDGLKMASQITAKYTDYIKWAGQTGDHLIMVGEKNGKTVVEIWNIKNSTKPTFQKRYNFDRIADLSLQNNYLYLNIVSSKKTISEQTTKKSFGNCTGTNYLAGKNSGTGQFNYVVGIPLAGGNLNSWSIRADNSFVLFRKGGFDFFAVNNEEEGKDKTEIYRYAFDKNKINFVYFELVEGSVLGPNSIIYQGDNTFVMTNWVTDQSSNNLFTLNKYGFKIGELYNREPGEKLYGLTDEGDRLYADFYHPMVIANPNDANANIVKKFIFNISNPFSPEGVNEITYPNYVTFTKPFGVGKNLGIGLIYTADTGNLPAELIGGGAIYSEDQEAAALKEFIFGGGLKIGLFDKNNGEKETVSRDLSAAGHYYNLSANPDNFLLIPDKNLLITPMRYKSGAISEIRLMAYRLSDNGISEAGQLNNSDLATDADLLKLSFYQNKIYVITSQYGKNFKLAVYDADSLALLP